MSSLLEQFRNAVDTMHTAVPAAAGMQPLASVPVQLAPVQLAPQPAMQPMSTAYQPLAPSVVAAPAKPANFFSKHWMWLVGSAIVLAAAGVAAMMILKKRKAGAGGKSRGGRRRKAGDDEDDEEPSLHPRIPTLHPQYVQQQQQSMPRVPPIASNIPVAPDMRYTEAPLRGAPLPPNTRGAEMGLQPPPQPSMQYPHPQQQPQYPTGGVLPMPPPTVSPQGIPLAQQPPMSAQPMVPQQQPQPGSQPPQDPNFTRL